MANVSELNTVLNSNPLYKADDCELQELQELAENLSMALFHTRRIVKERIVGQLLDVEKQKLGRALYGCSTSQLAKLVQRVEQQ